MAYNNLVSYCNTRRQKGWKVIICTEVRMKGNGSYGVCDITRMDLNNSIRANWTDFADGLADLGSNKSLGPVAAYKDIAYFCDEIHLTNLGLARVSEIISNAVNTLTNEKVQG